MLSVAAENEEVVGSAIPDRPRAALPELGEGWDFDDDDEMRLRYPRLTPGSSTRTDGHDGEVDGIPLTAARTARPGDTLRA